MGPLSLKQKNKTVRLPISVSAPEALTASAPGVHVPVMRHWDGQSDSLIGSWWILLCCAASLKQKDSWTHRQSDQYVHSEHSKDTLRKWPGD